MTLELQRSDGIRQSLKTDHASKLGLVDAEFKSENCSFYQTTDRQGRFFLHLYMLTSAMG